MFALVKLNQANFKRRKKKDIFAVNFVNFLLGNLGFMECMIHSEERYQAVIASGCQKYGIRWIFILSNRYKFIDNIGLKPRSE